MKIIRWIRDFIARLLGRETGPNVKPRTNGGPGPWKPPK